MDTGPGTMDQICRLFGVDKAEEILQNLKLIYVSHRHTDHTLGLNTILHERAKLFRKHSQTVSHDHSFLKLLFKCHFFVRFHVWL